MNKIDVKETLSHTDVKSVFSVDTFTKTCYNEYGGGCIEVSKARTFRKKIRAINSY